MHSGRLTTAAGRRVSTCLHPLSDPPVLSGFHAPPTRAPPPPPPQEVCWAGVDRRGEERASSRPKRPQQLLCSVGVSPVLHCRLAVERPRRQVSCDEARPYGKESAAIWTGRNPPTLSPGASHQAEEAYVEAFWRAAGGRAAKLCRGYLGSLSSKAT